MIPVTQVIEYIEAKCGTFPHDKLKTWNISGILAGGSVANAILSIIEDRPYKLNDLDVFVHQHRKIELTTGKEKVKSVMTTSQGYPVLFTNNLFMVNRVEEDDIVDIVTMQSNTIINPGTFPKAVLSSFDLNCVQAGIYWTGTEYKLETTNEFWDFINTKQIYVVNVHSKVTVARLLKKERDLDGYVNMSLELFLIANTCNIKDLKPLVAEQVTKHQNIIGEVNQHLDTLEDIKRPYYETWLDTKFQSVRQAKLRVLRSIQDDRNKKYVRDTMKKILFCYPGVTWISNFYNGSISEWVSQPVDYDNIKDLNDFIREHPHLQTILRSVTLPEMITRMRTIEKYQNKYSLSLLGDLETVLQNVEDTALVNAIKEGNLEYIMTLAVASFEKRKVELDRNFFAEHGKPLPTHTFAEGLVIKELVTALQLEEQGMRQHHCVGGYASKVDSGASRILSVYNTHTKELTTCELSIRKRYDPFNNMYRTLERSQHLGLQNRSPSPEAKLAVDEYLKLVNSKTHVEQFLKPVKDDFNFVPF